MSDLASKEQRLAPSSRSHETVGEWWFSWRWRTFGLRTDPIKALRAVTGHGEFGFEGSGGFNGARAGVTLAGANNDPGKRGESGFWGGVNVGDANAGIYDDGSTFSAGYNAHIINASAGYRTVDAESDHDRGLKLGVGVGAPSFGGRIHHGDADNDGRKEYGFGFHCPTPWGFGVSADYTSETLAGDAASVGLGAAIGGPLGAGLMMGANWGMDAIGLGDYAPGSLMQDGMDWVADGGIGRTADAVGGAISSGASAVWSAVTSW